MQIWVDLRADTQDARPARSFTIEAANLDAALDMITRAMRGDQEHPSAAAGGEDIHLRPGRDSPQVG